MDFLPKTEKYKIIFDKESRGYLLIIVLMIVGLAIFELIGVLSILPFLIVLSDFSQVENTPWLNYFYLQSGQFGLETKSEFLIALGSFSFVSMIVANSYKVFSHYQINRFVESQRYIISSRLLYVFFNQPYEFFTDNHSGVLGKAVLSEVDIFISDVLRPALTMLSSFLVMISLLTTLTIAEPVAAVLAGSILVSVYYLVFAIVRQKIAGLSVLRESSDKARYVYLGETLTSIKDLKMFNREDFAVNGFKKSALAFSKATASFLSIKQIPNFIVEGVVFGLMIALSIYLLLVSRDGSVSSALPILGLYAIAALRVKPSVHNLYAGVVSLNYGKSSIDSVVKYLSLPINKNDNSNQAIELSDRVFFKDVSFKYSGHDQLVLDKVSFHIPTGSKVGLVGSSGSGKSTIVNLILGLISPSDGEILIDKEPLNLANIDSWRGLIGYVSQDIILLNRSIAENIAFTDSLEKVDMDKVIQCAVSAGIADFISTELPNGYHTDVGERGARLSGGQKQRIGIARALYRDPQMLILDEATSALDADTESDVMTAIYNLASDKTVLIVAHRASALVECDKIIHLKSGCISHE